MIDVRCPRCNHKLMVNQNAVGSVAIKCDNCKQVAHVRLDKGTAAAR